MELVDVVRLLIEESPESERKRVLEKVVEELERFAEVKELLLKVLPISERDTAYTFDNPVVQRLLKLAGIEVKA